MMDSKDIQYKVNISTPYSLYHNCIASQGMYYVYSKFNTSELNFYDSSFNICRHSHNMISP